MGIIGSIRKHSGWAVAIVGLAIVAFIIGDLTKNQRGIPEVGKIAGTTITRGNFDNTVAEMEANYKAQTGLSQIPAETEAQIREQAWQTLVQETLTGIEMNRLGISVSSEELSDMYVGEFIHPYLRQMFTNPQTGVYDVQQIKYLTDNFEQLDTLTKSQWVELEKNLKKDRAMQKYTNLVTRCNYTPSAVAKMYAELSSTSSDVRVAQASFQSIPDEDVTLTDEDYKNYYNKHKADFRIREEIRDIDFIAFPIAPTQEDMAKIATEVETLWEEMQNTSDDELGFFVNAESDKGYDSTFMRANQFPAPFDSILASTSTGSLIAPRVVGTSWMMGKVQKTDVRPDSIRASIIWVMNDKAGGNITRSDDQAKAIIDSAEAMIKAGMSFEEAVQKYSDNKENNGDQGWQLDGFYGFLNEGIVSHAVGTTFTMERPDKLGYCLVKVTDKTPATKKYRVAIVTRDIVPSDATEKDIYNAANQFAGQNRSHAALISAAQEQNLMVRSDRLTSMANTMGGLRNTREIVRWAFDKETKIGDVAGQVYTLDDYCVVVALKDVFKKGYVSLDQVKPMIESAVRLEKKGDLLMAKAQEAAQKSKDIDVLAATMGTVVDSVTEVTFDGYYFGKFGMEPKLQAAVAGAKGNQFLGPIKGAQGVYFVQIDNQTQVVNGEEELKAKMASISAQRTQEAGQKANGIITMLMDKAKITDNRSLHF